MGFFYEADDLDWMEINMDYQGPSGENTWTCKDGWSTDSQSNEFTVEPTGINCHADTTKSFIEFSEDQNTATIRSHFMRMFKNTNFRDLPLVQGTTVSTRVFFNTPTNNIATNSQILSLELPKVDDALAAPPDSPNPDFSLGVSLGGLSAGLAVVNYLI